MSKASKSAEQVSAEAADQEAAKKAAAEEAKAQKKADAEATKAAKKAAADEAKAQREADKAAKQAQKDADKQAKAAEREAKKAEKQTKKERVSMPSQNGVTRPKEGTKTGQVWEIADRMTAEQGGAPVHISVLKPVASQAGLNDATVSTQYARWKEFNGIFGQVAKPAQPVQQAA